MTLATAAPDPAPVVLAPRRERLAWAMYDFASSGYNTVVLTAVFNAYFVGVVASVHGAGRATLLWTIAVAASNALVLLMGPVVGAVADLRACKKPLLALSAVGCIVGTAALAGVGRGDVGLAMALLVVTNFCFGLGENLVAAFLPELAPPDQAGRVSGFAWSLGYFGGILVLVLSIAAVTLAKGRGLGPEVAVPITMGLVALVFAVASLPTFLLLKERARPRVAHMTPAVVASGFAQLAHTFKAARRHRDLFRFLQALALYTCGIYTVVVIAAVYAQQVMGFQQADTIALVVVVNLTAAIGAWAFGHVQGRLGSVRTLGLTLVIWMLAGGLAVVAQDRATFWVVANMVGVAMGASQSAGRALVAQLAPPERSAEFFGLWGTAVKLAAVVGPLAYGAIAALSHGNQRLAIGCTLVFFALGLARLLSVDERRGRAAREA